MAKTEFEDFIQNSIEEAKGVHYPVNASLIERLIVRKAACKNIFPNPADEFCFPDIGPNYGIISDYVTQFKNNLNKGLPLMDEPLFVHKIRPKGYLLLNGHHRWAAARRLGIKSLPVKIVNSMMETEIRQLLEASAHDKRATIDLDEVLFRPSSDKNIEKKPGLIRIGIQKKALRRGGPALIDTLQKKGFDVWVYSSEYYSVDDIQKYFRYYHVGVEGVITGTMKKRKDGGSTLTGVEELIKNKYTTTLHIDNDLMLVTHSGTQEFEEFDLSCAPEDWAREAIRAVESM
ncbi:MAG: ParB-like nuclease domain-containing protein [Lachnospiraceae bacterium]|nr:ParB-like nuclease domain-containing protein [Lachnospiraceae bacterium]